MVNVQNLINTRVSIVYVVCGVEFAVCGTGMEYNNYVISSFILPLLARNVDKLGKTWGQGYVTSIYDYGL